jgi:hypothetical protein
LIGKANSPPTATRLREMSVPGTRVPRIEKEEDSFQSNTDGVILIGHYLQAFREVLINMPNHHGVMVITRNNVAVDVQ